jgi:hypothetical protein
MSHVTTTCQYNAGDQLTDRMTQVTNDFAKCNPTVSYVYDAQGRRIVRKEGTTWRMYFYEGLSVVVEKLSTNS